MPYKDKEKKKAYYKTYYKTHKEKKKAYNKIYHKIYYKMYGEKKRTYSKTHKEEKKIYDKIYHKTRRKRNKVYDKVYGKVYGLKYKYNLTLEEVDQMLIAQNHKCILCGRSLIETRRCIDHDHETGKVRGILCNRCNVGLAYIEDAIFNEKAKKYLKELKEVNNESKSD